MITLLKFIYYSLRTSLLAAAFLLSLGYFFIATQPGLQTLIVITQCFMPGLFSVQEVQGNLLSGIAVKNLHYTNKEFNVATKELNIVWNWSRLNEHKIVINRINLIGVTVDWTPLTETSNQKSLDLPSLASLLSHIVIDHIDLQQFKFNQAQHVPLIIDAASIQNNVGLGSVLVVKSPSGEMHGNVMLSLSKVIKWDTVLTIQHLNPNIVYPDWPGAVNVALTSNGFWSPNTHTVNLDISALSGKLKNLNLNGVINLSVFNQEVKIEKSQLQLDNASIFVNGVIGKQANIEWSVNVPQLQKVVSQAQGSVAMQGKITGTQAMPTIQADLVAKNILYPNVKIASINTHINADIKSMLATATLQINNGQFNDYRFKRIDGSMSSRLEHKKLLTNVNVKLSATSFMNGYILLPAFTTLTDKTQPIESKLNVRLNNPNEYLVIPQVKNLSGHINGQVLITGKINQPLIETKVDFNLQRFTIPAVGMEVRNFVAQANNKLNQAIVMSGKFTAGSGDAQFSGTFNPYQSSLPLHLIIAGHNLAIVNLPEYKITATPNLDFTYADQKMTLNGKLVVPHAEIVSINKHANVVNLPSEVVFVSNKQTTSNDTYANLALEISVSLGDNIHIARDELEANLQGNVLVRKSFGSLPVGSGELRINKGTYSAYDKTLSIQQGRLIYTGNLLTNPGLDMRAVQQVKAVNVASSNTTLTNDKSVAQTLANSAVYTDSKFITVGVAVKGTLNKPTITLFSDPAMSQEDVLSYLVFGYPRAQITDASSLALLNMFATTSNKGGKSLTNSVKALQNKLGLSQLSVGNTNYFSTTTNKSTNATTVNIGKQLGKKLSVNYSVGIFSPVSILGVRYQINQHFAIQSQASSMDNGADILYEYERD